MVLLDVVDVAELVDVADVADVTVELGTESPPPAVLLHPATANTTHAKTLSFFISISSLERRAKHLPRALSRPARTRLRVHWGGVAQRQCRRGG